MKQNKSPPASATPAGHRPSSNPIASSHAPNPFSSVPQSVPGGLNDPARQRLPSSFGPPPPPSAGTFQRFPTPQLSSTAQMPPVRPLTGPFSSPPPVPFGTQIQPPQPPPSVPPVGFPSQSINTMQPPGANVPQSSPMTNLQPSSPPMMAGVYPASRGPFQQSPFQGYPGQPPNVAPPTQPPNPVTYPPQQLGYAATMPGASRPYISPQGSYMQYPNSMPPTSTAQSLIEDFSSLSLASAPGSFDTGLDSKALPRPLDGDLEPKSFAEMYPMNCSSRYLRLSTCAIPNSQSLASRWHLPLGAVVCPLAEAPEGEEVPVVDFLSTGIIRCRRCRTYVNPYVTFTDHGRKWKCNICSLLNDVPGDYFAHLDASGRRVDLDQRPELTKGSVDFIAPAEYMVRPPMPPVYFFLIDVSVSAVKSGMLEVIAETIKSSLENLPGFPRTQIGFITFDSSIHFYNLKSSLSQPQMMVVSDLDDVFVPLPDDLLVNLSESRAVVDSFLDSLSTMFQGNVNVESAFGPALKAAFLVMNQIGGKLLIFQNTLPSLGAGRLRLRGDDSRVYGTDKEYTLRIPEDPFYKQMAADFSKFQIAVNVYAFSDKYADIASLGTLSKYTGGQVYHYPNFSSSVHGDRLRYELARDLTRETAWESVMRIRCGRGVRFTSYHGNFMLRSTDLMALPAVDCDKAYAMQFSLEETLLTTDTVYFQIALLYTSSSGERRIRVHTAAAPVVTDLGEMYRLADIGAVVSLLSRLAIEKSLSYKLDEARNSVQQRIVKALREYRNLYAVQHRLGGRLIYPDSLKLLPLYGLAIIKSVPLRGGYADSLDERCAAGYTIMALPAKKLLKLLYPNLVRVDELLLKSSSGDESENIWKRLPLAAESLDSKGLYVYDDGFRFIIWFGRMLSPDVAMSLLGDDFATDYSKLTLVERDNETSRRLMKILRKYRERDPSYYQLCHLVRQGEQPREGYFLLANLIEDQSGGTNGYADWILQLHRQVQQNA
ncbi:OLC1v1018490C1 [Oldenlandia corymbosa var. corymbosa]|uniref:OLC1v1018490C1 n=1 Tax=Oldenlandia corymbosa var. corymbosa TaxID=529605 RepID=A0AAV1EBP1_OLDCO|nr:OLC1v1018490C1 [Oldenlandia corymbosa var. corymbosa]